MGLTSDVLPGFAVQRVLSQERGTLRATGTFGPRRVPADLLALPVGLPTEAVRRAIDHARAAAAVDDPRVARVLVATEHDGRPVLVTGKPGGQRATRLWGNALAPPFVCALGLDLIAALIAGAGQGVHHGHIAPAQVAIDAGEAQLIGLGAYYFEQLAAGHLAPPTPTEGADALALHRALCAALAPDARASLGKPPEGPRALEQLRAQLGGPALETTPLDDGATGAHDASADDTSANDGSANDASATKTGDERASRSTLPMAPPAPASSDRPASRPIRVNILSGDPAQEPRDRQPRIGDVVGKCLLVEQLGAGASSVVFLGLHATLNTQVAVKVIASCDEMSRNEAQILARLRHPGIVGIFDYEQREAFSYIVLEYVKGASLHEVICQGGAIQPRRAIGVAREIVAALTYAESRGVLHRDLKPANVLLDAQGHARLADLGLASARHLDDPIGAVDAIVGTPGYVSPEQIEHQTPDHRSDIYSLGATLYDALAGQPPFSGPTLTVLMAQLDADPAPLQQLRPELPTPLCELVERMMRRDPEQRPQSYDDITAELDHIERELDPPPPDARSLTSRVVRHLRRDA